MNWDYISGFFDADGSVTLAKSNKNVKFKSLQVSFSNNELIILQEIQKFIYQDVQSKGYIATKPSKNINHEQSYELRFYRKQSLTVLNKIKSHHPKKIHRIMIANKIQFETKRNGKYSDSEANKRNKLIEEFFNH